MIDYDPKSWLRIVLTIRGSVVPRLLGRVAIAAGLGVFAAWSYDHGGFSIPPQHSA